MKLQKSLFCLLMGAAGTLSMTGHSFAGTPTGTFTGPLTSNLLASVDLNGGNASDAKPNQGFNGTTATPVFTPDQYGVTWSPWGGSNAASSQYFGDGTLWPQNQSGQAGTTSTDTAAPANPFQYTGAPYSTPTNNVNYFGRQFGTVHVGVSAPNAPGLYSTTPITSRDRGNVSGGITYGKTTGDTSARSDGDMYRDLIFAGAGSTIQGENFLQVQLTGLTAGSQYQVALFSYDFTSTGNSMNWTATAPTSQLAVLGYFASGTNTFAAPADEQTISFSTLGAPAVFTLTADANGSASVFGFGGNGVSGNQNAASSYLNGFQVAFVPAAAPEPSGIVSLLGGALLLGGLAMRARRRTVRA